MNLVELTAAPRVSLRMRLHAAYAAYGIADHAWSAELRRVYGAAAGDARYDKVRGCATPTLARLRQSARVAGDHWRGLSEQYRAADLARFVEGMRKHA